MAIDSSGSMAGRVGGKRKMDAAKSAAARAGRSFVETDVAGSQVVYVVSDGRETCYGDTMDANRKARDNCR